MASQAPKTSKDKRVPVTILTGFLGSGKTTLLNHILDDTTHGLRFAIIENEFGDVGIDEHILSEQCEEEVIEIMNGCICCTVRGDLVKTLKKLYGRIKQFDAIIIETTGLADPGPVAQTFFAEDTIAELFSLDAIITVVDAKHIISRLDDVKPAGVENEAVEQVAFADRILLNKIDLVTEEKDLVAVEKRLKKINPTVQIYRTEQSKIEPKNLLGLRAFSLDRILSFDDAFLEEDAEHLHDTRVTSVSWKSDAFVNVNKMQTWISTLLKEKGADLYRYKGVLSVAGMDDKFVFQGVGMLFAGGFKGKWPKGKKRESRFVFIGKQLDHKELTDGFVECQCKLETRFKVGDHVLANVGKWKPGKIIKLWDQGNPYRIELQDGKKTNVWGPVDEDAYVKRPDKAGSSTNNNNKKKGNNKHKAKADQKTSN